MSSGSLEQFVESVQGGSHLRIETDFGDGFVRLRTSEAERRQAAQDITCCEDIVLELLRNARDAHATRIYLAITHESSTRKLSCIDNGDGIPASMHKLVFEPRVTSKLDTSHRDKWGYHGRGMALYSIKVNSEDAKISWSSPGLGTAVTTDVDTTKVSERTDQSTFPTFTLGEAGCVNVRGPKNILRTACEFALEEHASCEVFVGSPTEILAALYAHGSLELTPIEKAFASHDQQLPLDKRVASCPDAESLAACAAELGLTVSERSARRVIDGQILEAESMLARIRIDSPATRERDNTSEVNSTHRNIRLTKQERDALASSIYQEFSELAEKYYLDSDVDIRIRARRDRLTIDIPIVPKHDE